MALKYSVVLFTILLIPENLINGKLYRGQFSSQNKPPYWIQLDTWGSCSKTCGTGFQTKRVICARQSILHGGPEHLKTDHLCRESALNSIPNTKRACNLGDCGYRYIWEPKTWGPCSQTCGASGLRTRDIICNYFIEGSGEKSITDNENCEIDKKPDYVERCNVINCLPEWVPGKWGSCKAPSIQCGQGIQKRKIECQIVKADNSIQKSSLLNCYKMMRQSLKKNIKVENWRFCQYAEQNRTACIKEKKPPKMETSDLTVVQMRKAKRLRLQIGQKAYVIPWTRVVVKCPVINYRRRDIIWTHNEQKFQYQGRSVKSLRIKVDRRGRLKIKRFQAVDQGEWVCVAESVKASIVVKMRSPSAGFQDWATRSAVRNEEMVNEDPKTMLNKADVVQWVQSDWSRCSITCGGKGTQTRTVRCERLDTRFYHILDESVCSSKMLPKPESKRVCNSPKFCPQWSHVNVDSKVCTDHCIDLNKGLVKGNLTCIMQGKILPYTSCDPITKPVTECYNENCEVVWKSSPWSLCSRSCGGQGISARHLSCVWKVMQSPAGSICYDVGIAVPEVIRPCNTPPCRLKCVDLSKHCGTNRALCRYATYRHQCCKSCQNV